MSVADWPPITCAACARPVSGGPGGYRCACAWCASAARGIVRLNASAHPGANYPPHSVAEQAAWERAHFWPLGRKRILGDIVSRWVRPADPGRPARFMEVGCGVGTVLAEIERRGLDVVGCDSLLTGLELARADLGAAPLFCLDGAEVPFDSWFDGVGLFDVVEHLDDERPLLEACRHAVKPGGHLVVSVPAYQALYGHRDRIGGHRRRYRVAGLCQVIESSGWRVQWASYFSSLLLPLFAAARLVERARPGALDSRETAGDLAEVRVIPIMNGIGAAALAAERLWLRLASIPAGTSLVVVAQRPQ